MPTEIRQIDDPETGRIILRVEGEMLRADAELVERIAANLVRDRYVEVTIDLADLDLLDSEAAGILLRLSDSSGCEIVGVDALVQSAIDIAERERP